MMMMVVVVVVVLVDNLKHKMKHVCMAMAIDIISNMALIFAILLTQASLFL
jgi:hypothetical protein